MSTERTIPLPRCRSRQFLFNPMTGAGPRSAPEEGSGRRMELRPRRDSITFRYGVFHAVLFIDDEFRLSIERVIC